MPSECRDCGKPMLWANTTEGRGVPLEPEPVPNGNYVLAELNPGAKPLVRFVKHGETLPPMAPRYIAHPKVCEKRRDQAAPPRPTTPKADRPRQNINRMIDEALRGEDAPGRGSPPGRGRGRRRQPDGLRGSQRKRKDR